MLVRVPAARRGGGGGTSLRDRRGFRSYLAGESAGLAGTSVHVVALPALAVLELGANAGQIALLAFLAQLPAFLLALPAGAIVDRHSKRALMVGTDVVAAGVVAAVPVAALAGVLAVPVLYGVALALGAVTVLHQAAAIAIVPELVEPAELHRANARIGAAFGAADAAGSHLGTLLVALLGAARAFWLDALSYAVSAWCAWRIPSRPRAPGPAAGGGAPAAGPGGGRRAGMASEVWEGLAYTARTPLVRTLVLAVAVTGFATGLMNTFFAFHLLTALRSGATGLGVVMGASGVGALAGALMAPRIVARIGPGRTLLAGFALCPVMSVPLVVARPGAVWLAVLGLAGGVRLAATAVAGTTQRALRQQVCPPELQSRAQQTSTWLVTGSRPFAALAGGALAAAFGVRAVLLAGTLLLVVPVAVLWWSPVSRLSSMPVPAADGPPPAVPAR
ncbi:MFS transporter [Streptomyces bambusae]|uniref:MFS transporter n=1 Tax=Streptomyces bambusae TaxID=1550616 RepID=UPI001CFCFDAD|nr:MFS transporter [Streptomyces bambusae]MCB5167724.1 MFS transporter [Streptomyces bambusae]